MEKTDHSSDRLHQQASAQYLQGKFEEALATWRQILANDPSDERASEGIRLCELLTADGPAEAAATFPTEELPPLQEQQAAPPVDSEPTAAAAPAVDPPSETEPLDDLEFELPNLDLDLPPAEIPDPSRQDEGIDFGEMPEALQVDGEIPEAPPQEPVVVGEALPEMDAPVVEGIIDDALSLDTADSVAAEQGQRVHDLVNEARAAHAGGDLEAARAALQRVFVLDETNTEALELQERLEDAVPPTTDKVDIAELDAPLHGGAPGEFDLAAEAPDGTVAAETESIAVGEPEVDEALLADPILDEMPDEEFDSALEDAIDDEPGIELPQLDSGSSKTRWVVAGVVAGIVLVAGVGFWMKLKSASTIEPLDSAAVAPAEAAAAAAPVAAEATPASSEPEQAPAESEPVEDVATLLARGNDAFDSGDYAQAIIAFNGVLDQQPEHYEATSKMEVATQNYRAQQEVQQQWLAATSLFRDGEFRSALQMFYRLPQDSEEDRMRLQRYQENGWFNMGLQALRSGHCDSAREHFTEAVQIDPEDADVQMALALCDTCDSGSRRSGFQRAVASMKLRGLDD